MLKWNSTRIATRMAVCSKVTAGGKELITKINYPKLQSSTAACPTVCYRDGSTFQTNPKISPRFCVDFSNTWCRLFKHMVSTFQVIGCWRSARTAVSAKNKGCRFFKHMVSTFQTHGVDFSNKIGARFWDLFEKSCTPTGVHLVPITEGGILIFVHVFFFFFFFFFFFDRSNENN